MDLKRRSAGVLMNISSLPGPYGVGGFGEEARRFADTLSGMGFRFWQVLPFNPVDAGNSPYASASAFAGNPLYIDPRALLRDGLITAQEEKACRYSGSPYTADYAFAREKKEALLRAAFARSGAAQRERDVAFAAENPWVEPYALFMAAKERQNGAPWWEWPKELADYAGCQGRTELKDAAAFHVFVQRLFSEEWEQLKAYINGKGIGVIGDMPMYVSMDSCDVWSHRELFDLDLCTGRPCRVAGVPPDYFSADGQLWGNPLYNWAAMERDGYAWWCARIGAAFSRFDVVRIDHFRAFASYWAVPADAETAKAGKWMPGPGQALFDAAASRYPSLPIIAEDLGVFGEDVEALLESTGFPGMRVVQFGFTPDGDSTHLPHNYPFNTVAYVGTHDNNTLLGWLWEASPAQRAFALHYCGYNGTDWGQGGYKSPACRKVIETVWRSAARTAVIAFQDMCGFGSDARMNIPGQPESNWRFRTTEETIAQMDQAYFADINRLFRRA